MKIKSLYIGILLAIFLIGCEKVEIQREIIESTDKYVGDNSIIALTEGLEEFTGDFFTLTVRTLSGEKIKRSGIYKKNKDNHGQLILDYGVKDGEYELLNMEHKVIDEDGKIAVKEFGLGCKITFKDGVYKNLSKWHPTFKMYGTGTEVDTLYVSSEDKLQWLRKVVNSSNTNNLVNHKYYFLQTDDLDGAIMSMDVSMEYGWMPIGSQQEVSFKSTYDGGGYTIDGLYISRSYMYAAALFGFTNGAYIKNVNMTNAKITGDFGVSGIVGIVVSGANNITGTIVENCTVNNSIIKGAPESYGVAGLVGVIDMNSALLIQDCKSYNNTITSSNQAGGVVGAGSQGSIIKAYFCENNSTVSSEYNSSGGIIAACDTLLAGGCVNRGTITGASKYTVADPESLKGGIGCGGIAGGTSTSMFTACANYGSINGKVGVGGIIGSTRKSGSLSSENYLCNTTILLNCKNEGNITGNECVGGLCGEAQIGCRGSLNKGSVTANSNYAGGVVGSAPIAMVLNNINTGKIKAYKYAGGIVGFTESSVIIASQNFSDILAEHSYAAGIIAKGLNDITLNYCGNFGSVRSDIKDYTANFGGELGAPEGEPDITSIVVGSVEVVAGAASLIVGYIPKSGAVDKILTFASVGWSMFTLAVDGTFFKFSIEGIISNEKIREQNEENLELLNETGKKIEEELSATRDGSEIDYKLLGLDKEYKEEVERLVKHLDVDGNLGAFTDSLNQVRENKLDRIQKRELVKEIIHTCVSGVCIAASMVATICTIVATGGSATAAVLGTWIGGLSGIVGGGNTIIQALDTYEENIVTLDQCIAAGIINVPKENEKTGGLVGQLNSYGEISDCLNLSTGTGNGGHIVGYAGHQTIVKNCLTLAPESSWGGIYSEKERNTEISGIYYLVDNTASSAVRSMNGATAITMEELSDPNNLKGWDFRKENGRWFIPEGENRFPIPYVSRYIKTQN